MCTFLFSISRLMDGYTCEKRCSFPILNIQDSRDGFKQLKDPFKRGINGDIIQDKKGEYVYLHPFLDPTGQLPEVWDEHNNEIVVKDRFGMGFRVCDFWEKVSVNAVNINFLEQITLQISPLLFSLFGKLIPKSTKMFVFDSTAIEKNRNSYLYIGLPELGILGVDALWIKWKSLISEKEYIRMDEAIDSSLIEFKFCTLEEESICSQIKFNGRNDIGVGSLERLQKFYRQMQRM